MQVLLALLACLGSSAFILPPVPTPGIAAARRYASPAESTTPDDGEVYFLRRGVPEEKRAIQEVLLGMLMNPTSIDVNNFLCAEEHGTGSLIGFGQVRPIGESSYELASLHVAESHRQRGLGSRLVRQLAKDFASTHGSEQLYLLTLAKTAPFYEKNGFAVIPPNDTPAVLKAERAVGSFVQSFFGNSLVCMQAISE